jgi:alkanesulfonate monooxygenase SsuD/methylene tetrahydromethanopterin reductase-like flavin-dependent oxidoreductase (luciferase family)
LLNDRFIEILSSYINAVWVEDHLQWKNQPTTEGWTTLSCLADKYPNPNLTLTPIVLGQSYRNPELTAKMAATIHYLTRGQTIFGIGSGWKEDEYLSYGWDFPSPKTRIEQLDDTLSIIKAMCSQSPSSFHGKQYSPSPDHESDILLP